MQPLPCAVLANYDDASSRSVLIFDFGLVFGLVWSGWVQFLFYLPFYLFLVIFLACSLFERRSSGVYYFASLAGKEGEGKIDF